MKAILTDKRAFTVISDRDVIVLVKMDLYKIQGKEAKEHPGGFRFSWIAFNAENPSEKVLFDSHPPKGPHFHLNNDSLGVSFKWESLEKTEKLFFELVSQHFNIKPESLT